MNKYQQEQEEKLVPEYKKLTEQEVSYKLNNIQDYQDLLEFHKLIIPNIDPDVVKKGMKIENAPPYNKDFKGEDVWIQLMVDGKIGLLDDAYYRAFWMMPPISYQPKYEKKKNMTDQEKYEAIQLAMSQKRKVSS